MKKEKKPVEVLYLKTDGTQEWVKPTDGKKFTLKELQNFVGGLIQFVPLPSGATLVCNDEGKLEGLEPNKLATEMWKREYPLEKYPIGNDSLVVGNVLVGRRF